MLIETLMYAISWMPLGVRLVVRFAIYALIVFVLVKLVLLIKDLIFRWL